LTIDQLKFTKNQFNEFLQLAHDGQLLDNQMKIVMDEMLQS